METISILSKQQVDLLKDLFRYECLGFGFEATMSRVDNDIEVCVMYPDFLLIYLGGSKTGKSEYDLRLSVHNAIVNEYGKIVYELDRIQKGEIRLNNTLLYYFKVDEIKLYTRHIQVFNKEIEDGFNDFITDSHILLKTNNGNILLSMDDSINGSIYLKFSNSRIEEYLELNHMGGDRNQFNTLRLTMRYNETTGQIEEQLSGQPVGVD